jgi:hypothetical protein
MIGFVLPWMLGLAVVGALAVVVLHLLSVHRPPALWLPTARFLPDRQVRAVSRTRRPSDLLLLLLRVLVLVLAGMAAAGPLWQSRGSRTVALAVIDAGITVNPASDSATLSTIVRTNRLVITPVAERGDKTLADDGAVWPTAWRAAAHVVSTLSPTDSLVLHVFVRHADAVQAPGWRAWRATWPGRVVVHTPSTPETAPNAPRRVVVVRGDTMPGVSPNADDVVVAALQWHAARIRGGAGVAGAGSAEAVYTDTVVVYRNNNQGAGAEVFAATASDAGPSATIRLFWPRDGIPSGFTAIDAEDTTRAGATALVAAGHAIVAPFTVAAQPAQMNDALYRALVWYGDGRVAAYEPRSTPPCNRYVAVTVPSASDLLVGPSANGVFDNLLAPCLPGTPVTLSQFTAGDISTADDSLLSASDQREARRSYPLVRDFARASGIPLNAPSRDFLLPALLVLALLLLVMEGRLRDHPGDVS